MPTPPPNDIEIYYALNLATLVPRTDRGRVWIEQKLKPSPAQSGYYGAYFTHRSEVRNLRTWMHRDKLVTKIILPP